MNILLKFLLLFIVVVSLESKAKSPPPGIGADIPANILLMLQTSDSMNTGARSSPLRTVLDTAVDSNGNVFVTQVGDSLIKKFDSNGDFVKSWGGRNNPLFYLILRIAVDTDGNVYGTDTFRNKIHKWDNDGKHLKTWSVPFPDALEVDSAGNIYSSESSRWTRKMDQSGRLLARYDTRSYAGSGGYPFGISSYGGYVYVANAYNRSFTKYTEDLAPAPGTNKWSASSAAWDVKASVNGVYVASIFTHTIQKFSHDGVLLKTFGGRGHRSHQLYYPAGLSIGSSGNVYVADRYNHSVKVFDSDGEFLWYLGGKTRLDNAKESLKWIVSNSELNKGADFGLMTWDGVARMEIDIKPDGANEIYSAIDNIKANCKGGGCKNIGEAMDLARSYLAGKGISPKSECQKTGLVIITDEDSDAGIAMGNEIASNFSGSDNEGILTFVLSLSDDDITEVGVLQTLKDLAENGGTYSPDGDDTNDLSPIGVNHKQKMIDALIDFIRISVDGNTSTFTRPVIKQEADGGEYVYHSTFSYVKNSQWKGSLKKYKLNEKNIPESIPVWDAAKKLNQRRASDRNIWTIANIYGIDTTINNFIPDNSADLEFLLWKYAPEDPTDTEVKNLINFVRGVDTYNEVSTEDEEKDNLLSGERWKLADIYHSELNVVDAPSAEVSSKDANTEAYYRFYNGYQDFVDGSRCGPGACKDRKQVVYAGANDGLLHAFEHQHGKELWAFLPPMKIRDIRNIISTKTGQTHSLYGVDGSPVIKDVYFDKKDGRGKKWYTVLIAGLGMGGGGYFALDITNPDAPLFLFAFRNDVSNQIISHWDSSGDVTELGYDQDAVGGLPVEYDYSKIGDATSAPQIILMPYKGEQKWVAVFGAGFNAGINDKYGSSIYIIDLEDSGKVLRRIDIADLPGNNISNSVPASVIAITSDTNDQANYKGAMVYFADLEGSLWKLNLTDQSSLFSIANIVESDATFANDRMEFFELTQSTGSDGNLWLHYGTGNQQKLQRISTDIQNRVYGIKDIDFPKFMDIVHPPAISTLLNTTEKGARCPTTDADLGWYVDLDANERVTGQLAISDGFIYVPRYTPNTKVICELGNSIITEQEAMCGLEDRRIDLGQGIVTSVVIYKDTIFAGIGGDQNKDLMDKDEKVGERRGSLTSFEKKFRSEPPPENNNPILRYESWRELF